MTAPTPSPSIPALPDEGGVRVTIAVPTFHRPDDLAGLLPQLLEHLAGVTAGGRYAGEVLVVDNDPAASAAVVAAAVPGVRYVTEPSPGIAAVRNRAIDEAAASRLLVFLDDDERPCAGWLSALLATWEGSGAAAVCGRVQADLAGPLDPWIEAGRFFDRRRLPTGAEIDVAATGNLLLDLDQVRAAGTRFESALGLAGGEDNLFSRSLAQAGGRMVWCDESVAIDRFPPERLTRGWLRRRILGHGNTTVLTELWPAVGLAARLRIRGRGLVRGLALSVAGSGRWALGRVTGSLRHQARGTRAVLRGVGMVAGALGLVYEEYARDGRRWRRSGAVRR